MAKEVSRKPSQSPAARFRVPRWVAAVAGIVGTLFGIATNLYAAEFRALLERSGQQVSQEWVSIFLTAAVSAAVTAAAYRIIARRRQVASITPGTILINSSVLSGDVQAEDAVVGRSMKFLESKRGSKQLVVFLHGLGLDGNDFRPYMAESAYHCIALTMYGFNTEEAQDEDYKPISLRSHVSILSYCLERLHTSYPRKTMTLVGFSFGADMCLFLGSFAETPTKDLGLANVILLDPNMNNQTLTISSQIASVDVNKPLEQLHRVLQASRGLEEFRDYCEYMFKITSKNFAQIKTHAGEVVSMWPNQDYDDFLNRLGRLSRIADRVQVVLSRTYERHFNAVTRGAAERGLDVGLLEASTSDHFELLDTRFLKTLLEGAMER